GLDLIRDAAEVEALARSEDDNGGEYLVPAFTGLGAPHWDQSARGTMIGLTRGSTARHIARAALESIAFQTKDVLKAMQWDSGIEIEEMRVDEGVNQNDMIMKFQADILGIPIIRPKVFETTAMGAEYLAGLATGLWDDIVALKEQGEVDKRFES